MGNCQRRGRGAAQADAALLAQLDAVLSLRKQPAKKIPGSQPPTTHTASKQVSRQASKHATKLACKQDNMPGITILWSSQFSEEIFLAAVKRPSH